MENIRNFCIIAHIDHGKSTLADRFLELTKTIEERKMKDQLLDTMDLERERGITIKLQPVRMNYELNGQEYILNLIDTPGHVDFSYEVSRSLAAVEGAILLVDATQGIQAQTLANLRIAQKEGLAIIPVINKIDMDIAEPERVAKDLANLLKISEDKVLKISARSGEGVEEVLKEVIKNVPEPKKNSSQDLSALVFDSVYDSYRGVVAFVRVFSGELKAGQGIALFNEKVNSTCDEVGTFSPTLTKKNNLSSGEIGYVVTGLKDLEKCRVGETITLSPTAENFQALEGYTQPQSNVYASIFPTDADDFSTLAKAAQKLKLNDASLDFTRISSPALGSGIRCGFLGMLHMEIVAERFKREYLIDVVLTPPSVEYKIRKTDGEEITINDPEKYPDQSAIETISEPWAKVEIITPSEFLGAIMELLPKLRGELRENKFLDQKTTILTYEMPLSSIVTSFYDQLKSITSGYGSFSYKQIGFRPEDLVKLDILIAGDKTGAFSQIIHRSGAQARGRTLVKKLKELIPKQMFQVSLQAAVGSYVVAREDISAMKKDVIAKLYGGDRTRKDKLLKKQAAGKKKMKQLGRVEVPSDIFIKVLKN